MIPDYQTVMLPFLKQLADGKEHGFREIIENLAVEFSVTEEERKEFFPSGSQNIFDNRIGWARTYLKKAKLIESPKRGYSVITEDGLMVLKEKPDRIDVAYLKRFPAFTDFIGNKKEITDEAEQKSEIVQTPEESLEASYQELRKSLAQDLLQQVLSMSPAFFERLVVELLVKMGYGGSINDAGRAIGRSGDEGIDGTIKEDRLGLDIIYIQAKRWQKGNVVGRPEIQKFVGALAGQGAKKGIFITTSSFTREAVDYTPRNETKIVLIDGEKLSQFMIDFGIGVSMVNTYAVKRIDSDYFSEE